jgi:hypothetical protein
MRFSFIPYLSRSLAINKDKAGVIRASIDTGDLDKPHPYF